MCMFLCFCFNFSDFVSHFSGVNFLFTLYLFVLISFIFITHGLLYIGFPVGGQA